MPFYWWPRSGLGSLDPRSSQYDCITHSRPERARDHDSNADARSIRSEIEGELVITSLRIQAAADLKVGPTWPNTAQCYRRLRPCRWETIDSFDSVPGTACNRAPR